MSFGNISFIVKWIDPDPNRRQSFGDQRKALSYQVEARFYESYADELIQKHDIAIPKPYLVERQGERIIICMSILQEAASGNQDSFEENTIRWLASFHAATWGNNADGLQPVGSYWHLDTRPEELESMPRKGWQGRLKRAARAIDDYLKRDSMQCIIHGDAKDANVLQDGDRTSMCDFQYVGRGTPTRDLAYFLCSSTDPENESSLLILYHNELTTHLPNNIAAPSLEDLKTSLELAYCDFARFMCGWGFWGFDLTDRVVAVLDRLDGGNILASEAAYDEAVRREYG